MKKTLLIFFGMLLISCGKVTEVKDSEKSKSTLVNSIMNICITNGSNNDCYLQKKCVDDIGQHSIKNLNNEPRQNQNVELNSETEFIESVITDIERRDSMINKVVYRGLFPPRRKR